MRRAVLFVDLVAATVLAAAPATLRGQEAGWVKMTGVPTTANLYAVTGVSRTRAWAGGEHGTLLMWDGVKWSQQELPDPSTYKGLQHVERAGIFINDIWMFGESDGWAVGHFIHKLGRIYRWNGTTWSLHTKLEAEDSDLVNVAFASPSNGIAVASHGRGYVWDGTNWDSIDHHPWEVVTLEDVEAIPRRAAYWEAVTGNRMEVQNPVNHDFVRFCTASDVGQVTRSHIKTPGGPATSDVSEIFALSDGQIFYMSSHRNILRMLTPDGVGFTGFTYQFNVDNGLRNFWMLSGTEGWFVGNAGLVSHYRTDTKTGPGNTNTFPTDQRLTDIWMLDKDFGFIVGDGGTILQRTPPPALRLSLAPAAYSFSYRAEVTATVVNTSQCSVPKVDGHWNIKTRGGTVVKRTEIPYQTARGSLDAGRPLKLAWNQNGDDGKPVGPGEYEMVVRFGDYSVSAPFVIMPPASDHPDVVGAFGGLELTVSSTVAPGAEVVLSVRNRGSQPVDLTGAQYAIDRKVNDSWHRYFLSASGVLGTQSLAAARTQTLAWNRRNTAGPGFAPPGLYRITLTVPAATSDLQVKEFTLE